VRAASTVEIFFFGFFGGGLCFPFGEKRDCSSRREKNRVIDLKEAVICKFFLFLEK
jgi:hypothetical protein